MTIIQFLRILWARRRLILAAPICCLLGAVLVGLIAPARWEAHSRVMLNVLKPDPVTGLPNAGEAMNAYINTQGEIIKDYTVAGQVAERLGWLTNPKLIRSYERKKHGASDFRHWLGQIVIDSTKTNMVAGSNILDIAYTAKTALDAKRGADAVRAAYLDTSVARARQDAARTANWYASQAQQARSALDAAELAKTDFERTNGVVLQDNKLDVESARLQALTGQSPAPASPSTVSEAAPQSSGASTEVAQIDSSISQAARTLGPNHPEMQDLRAKRAALIAQMSRQSRAQSRGGGGGGGSNIAAIDRAVSVEKSKVLAEGDKVARLKELQADVDLHRDQLVKASARAAELRQATDVPDVGLSPLASAMVPTSPTFPKWSLMIPGSIVLGLGVGVLAALLMELAGRRVRGPEDLEGIAGVPLLAVIGLRPAAFGLPLLQIGPPSTGRVGSSVSPGL